MSMCLSLSTDLILEVFQDVSDPLEVLSWDMFLNQSIKVLMVHQIKEHLPRIVPAFKGNGKN